MKFRIVKNEKIENAEKPYEVFYFDEADSKGPKWRKVIWDEKSYCNFCDKKSKTECECKSKVNYEKESTTVFCGEIWETPDVSQTYGTTCRSKNEPD